jgi:hypothetical protein
METNKKHERKLKDYGLMDPANVACIIPISNRLYDTGDLEGLKDIKFKEEEWSKVSLTVKQENYFITDYVKFSKEYCDWFLKILSAFFNRKVKCIDECRLYVSEKNSPILIEYDNVGMLLAPRVENE